MLSLVTGESTPHPSGMCFGSAVSVKKRRHSFTKNASSSSSPPMASTMSFAGHT